MSLDARPESKRKGRPAGCGSSLFVKVDLGLRQAKRRDQDAAVAACEERVTAAIARDLDAEQVVADEGRLDDEVARVSGDHTAVGVPNDFRAALEDPLHGVEAVGITRDQRAGES